MGAYFIALIDIEDEDGYAEYLGGFDQVFASYDGRVVAVEDNAQVLEGVWPAARTVLIRFPDESALRDWYDSPEYQAIREHRLRSARCRVAIVRSREPKEKR
ncbi:MAG: DUF1330 domain-containing protein [Anaerolineaceae bacterium]|nr:DUF1330 domain-containing protein [Anaerolineaceae bacterium]